MGSRLKESKRQEVVDCYLKNPSFSAVDVAKQTGICAQMVRRILESAGIKLDRGRWGRHKSAAFLRGKAPWNKGKTKYTDDSVAKYSKTKSQKGSQVRGDGYQMVWSDELKKAVRAHHYVWFKKTGHWPNTEKGEQVHHIDGNKLNNDFSNLVLVSVADHSAIHKQYELVTCELIKMGLVEFDKRNATLDATALWNLLKKLNQ